MVRRQYHAKHLKSEDPADSPHQPLNTRKVPSAANCSPHHIYDAKGRLIMPISGFDHAAIPVSDVDRTVQFYQSLGFTALKDSQIRMSDSCHVERW